MSFFLKMWMGFLFFFFGGGRESKKTIFFFYNRGVVTDEGGSLFDNKDVCQLITKPEWAPDIREYPRHVLITCDPNTHDSRRSSEMALVAMTLVNGHFTVSILKKILFVYGEKKEILIFWIWCVKGEEEEEEKTYIYISHFGASRTHQHCVFFIW